MFSLLVAVLASAPAPCARNVVFEGRPLRGGPGKFCIEQVLRVELAEGAFVVLRVAAPHRFEARVRSRVFVYRLEGDRLVPRFLGSGFAEREVVRLVALEGALGVALGVETQSASGEKLTWGCTFEGFPLVCTPG